MEEFKFKKKYGQNFLQNKAIIDKIDIPINISIEFILLSTSIFIKYFVRG